MTEGRSLVIIGGEGEEEEGDLDLDLTFCFLDNMVG
jgi:hypothetical protein